MSDKIRIGIIGGAGYTGGELIRILLHHPHTDIIFIHSRSNENNLISSVHTDLLGDTDLKFTGDLSLLKNGGIDVVFLCVGHGEAKKFIAEASIADDVKIIDLSQDFRLQPNASISNRKFIYGLPELNKDEIKTAKNIANPGCFATAIQLGLLPLAKNNMLTEVYTTGITGSTGAGQGFSATSHFSWRANNIQAYKTLSHQHLKEITQSLHQLQGAFPNASAGEGIHFVPWRGDFTRGIFISSTVQCNLSLEQVSELYQSFYSHHPFTIVSAQPISLKQVVNTNKCVLQLEKEGNKLVVHSAMDNLVKGASGQAVQNMNLMCGLDECAGLQLKPNAF